MTPKKKLMLLTPGAVDLAEEVIKRRRFLVGRDAIKVSTEVAVLVRWGIARARRSYLIRCKEGREALERALAQQNSAAQESAD